MESLARQADTSVEDIAARLLRERIREEAFPQLEYRDTAAGRDICIKGNRLCVWQVALVARHFGMDPSLVAEHLQHPLENIRAALAYAAAYHDEIGPIVEEAASTTFEDLKRRVPGLVKAQV